MTEKNENKLVTKETANEYIKARVELDGLLDKLSGKVAGEGTLIQKTVFLPFFVATRTFLRFMDSQFRHLLRGKDL